MIRYSEERKAVVLNKLLPPHNLSVSQVAVQEGISEASLYNWRRQARQEGHPVPGNRKVSPDNWDAQDKLAVVIETSGMNAQELSEYCRSKGLYAEQIEHWKQDFIEGVSHSRPDSATKEAHKKIRKLERELKRKDKALAEAAALLVLQKKFQALWEEEEQ